MGNSNRHFPGPSTIVRTTLPNGIVVLLYENFAAESFVLEGSLPAGALVNTRAEAGLADFTADMLLRGTQQRTFEDIFEQLEAVGASLDFSADYHSADFSGSGLVEDLDLVLTLAAEALRYPTFPEEHIARVRAERLTGLQIRANDTRRMAGLRFREMLYQGHPYGVSVAGYPDSVAAIIAADLRRFHETYYGPRGLVLTLVGAISAADALARITAVFGDWQAPAQQPLPPAPAAVRPHGLARTQVAMPGKTQADIVLGVPGPLRSAPDFQQVRLANVILGVFGMMGRLGKSVREEQGLAYYAQSSLLSSVGPAPWTVRTGVAPGKVEQALASIRAEIRRMQTDLVPPEELQDSQAFLTGSLPVGLETNSGLASIISDMETLSLGLDYLERYRDEINQVTPEQVRAAAQSAFSADDIVVAVAGPPDA